MSAPVDDLVVFMYLEVHEHMFLSALQFKTWYSLLKGEIEEMEDPSKQEDLLMWDSLLTQNTTILVVKAKALHYARAPGIHHSYPPVNPLCHMSVSDSAIHFWRKGLPGSEILQQVDQMYDRRYQVAMQASYMSLAISFLCHPMKL